jgi:hypothetical protein
MEKITRDKIFNTERKKNPEGLENIIRNDKKMKTQIERRKIKHLTCIVQHSIKKQKTLLGSNADIKSKYEIKKSRPLPATSNFLPKVNNDKFFKNNIEYLLYIIHTAEKSEKDKDIKNELSNSYDGRKTIINQNQKKAYTQEKFENSLSFSSCKDDSLINILPKNFKLKLGEDYYGKILKNVKNHKNENGVLELSEDGNVTDNSFILANLTHLKKKNSKAKKFLLDYKKRVNVYFPDDQQNSKNFQFSYKRIIYLPIYIKMTRKFISVNFEILEQGGKKFKDFLKEYKSLYYSYKDRKKYEFKKTLNENIEVFLNKFQHFAFCDLIGKISQIEHNEEQVKYKTTKIVFTRLINNLRENNLLKQSEMYEKLSKNLISLLSVKSKNFYLQESLNNLKRTSNISVSKGRRGRSLMTIISDNLNKVAIKNKMISRIKGGIRSPRTVLPFSSFRLAWDIILSICITYNLISIPFYFLEKDHKKLYIYSYDVFDMVIDGIIFLDIAMNFRTGFIDSGNNIVMNIEEIKQNYLLKGFIWDMCSTFPWEILFFSIGTRLVNLFKLPRILRVSRIIKLAEKLHLRLVKIILLLIIFFLFAHWIGCLSYMLLNYVDVSMLLSTNELNICDSHDIIGQKDFKTSCKYFFSLYGGMQILNSESIEIYHNISDLSRNAIFILAYILGQLAFSVIVGLISSSVHYFEKANYKYFNQMRQINDHLEFNNISGNIRNHVNIYYDYIWKNQKDLLMKTDSVYQMSDIIRHKIIARTMKNIIPKMDFIKGDDTILGKVLEKIRKRIIIPYQIIFMEGEVTEGLYIQASGKIFFEVKSLYGSEREKFNLCIPQEKNKFSPSFKGSPHLINNYVSCVTSPSNGVGGAPNNPEKQNFFKYQKRNNYIEQSQSHGNKERIITQGDIGNQNKPQNEVNKATTKTVIFKDDLPNLLQDMENQKIELNHQNLQPREENKDILVSNINNFINISNTNSSNVQVNIIQNNLQQDSEIDYNKRLKRRFNIYKKMESKISIETILEDFEKITMNKFYFDLISIMITSSRNWCTSYSKDFCELELIKYKDLISLFNENKSLFDALLREAKIFEKNHNIFANETIFKLISLPSSRTNKKLYRKGNLTLENIWLINDNIHNPSSNHDNYETESYMKDIDRINGFLIED